MATLAIVGAKTPLPSFSFPFIAPAANPATYLDPPYPTEELPSFTLGTDPTPGPIVGRPIHPLPPIPPGAGGQVGFPI